MVGWFYGHMTVAQFAISFVFPLLSCFLSKACFACIVISSLHNSSFTRPIILSSLLTQLCTSLSLQELQQQHILSIQSHSAISQEATAAKAGKETICNVRSLRTRTGSHKTTVGRLCESQGWGSFFPKEIATAYKHYLCCMLLQYHGFVCPCTQPIKWLHHERMIGGCLIPCDTTDYARLRVWVESISLGRQWSLQIGSQYLLNPKWISDWVDEPS